MAGWEHHYQNPIGGGTTFDDAILNKIRFGELALAEDGQMGAQATAQVIVDDPLGALDFSGWGRWYVLETSARANAALTGTVDKTAGLVTIVGHSTLFLTELAVGDEVKIPGGTGTDYVTVAAIIDNTHFDAYVAAHHTATGQAATLGGLRHTWHGLVGVQEIDRGDDRTGGSEYGLLGRDWTLDLLELNAILYSRLPTTNGAGGSDNWNRRKETPAARLAFMVGSTIFSQLGIVDEGLVDYPTTPELDKDDMRGRPIGECLNAIATIVKRTFALRYHEVTGHIQLVFKKPEAFYLPSGITISNNLDDKGQPGVWVTDRKAKLTRDPTKTASGLFGTGGRYTAYRTRAGTEDVFGRRDDSATNATVKSKAKLEAYLDADLEETATQDEHGKVTIPNVPAAEVNRVQKLSAVVVRISHWPNWIERYARVLRREIHDQAPGIYTVDLDLGPCSAPPGHCGIACLPTHTSYPLGGDTDFFNPVPAEGETSGGQLGPGFMYMCRSGLIFPVVPTPGYIGRWWFKTFGSLGGGDGTIDYAGHNVGNNTLRAVVVGNGTLTVHTVPKDGGSGTFNLNVFRQTTAGIPTNQDDYFTETSSTSHATGETVTVTVSDGDGALCLTIVDLTDFASVDFGWSAAEWVSDGCEG